MSDATVETMIEELVKAAETGNIEEATSILEDIADRFDELRTTERGAIRRSAAARQSDNIQSEALEELTAHIQSGADTQMSRAAFLLEAVSILRELEEEDSGEVSETQSTSQSATDELGMLGERIQTQQSEYEQTAAAAAETTEDVDVAAQVSVESIDAPNTADAGEEFTVGTTVQNVGDDAAEDVVVSVRLYEDSEEEAELSAAIGTLEGGERVSEQWDGISNAERVTISVESSTGGTDSSQTTILVREPSIDDYANDEGIVDIRSLRDAIDDWRAGDIDNDLLGDVIDAWRSGQAVGE